MLGWLQCQLPNFFDYLYLCSPVAINNTFCFSTRKCFYIVSSLLAFHFSFVAQVVVPVVSCTKNEELSERLFFHLFTKMNVIFIHDGNTSLQCSENKDIWRYSIVLFHALICFVIWMSVYSSTLKQKNKQNKGSWVAHTWHNWLYHTKWNHTIRGRATKPVFPRHCRNENPAALLSLLQIQSSVYLKLFTPAFSVWTNNI